MKSTFLSRTLIAGIALLFPILTCFSQDIPVEKVVGTWIKVVDTNTITITFTADKKSTVEFTGDDVIDVYGTYDLYETQITFTDEGGEYAADVQGVYDVKLGDNTLTFTMIEDPVSGRSMMVEGTWTKAKEAE